MRRGFTLIELLVVIAIIAVLAAILFPVFASAKISAKVTSSLNSMKQLALAFPMYSADSNDRIVWDYGYGTQEHSDPYMNGNTWVGRIFPYVKNRSAFFDKMVPEPKGDLFDDPYYPQYNYRWEWITNYSINSDGFSRYWSGSSCQSINWGGEGNGRYMTNIADPAQRLAVAPTRYANLPYSWTRFYAIDAAWPTMDRYAGGWDWYQLIWDARRQYPGPKFTAAYADGHAGKFGREKFVVYYADSSNGQNEATTYAQFCAKMDEKQLWPFWGKAWSSD
ncbi:MAG: hypothetical protein HONBIEJF_02198 [Fimbriimonadaceae bacterium]|nr:hypothetical protein [Fimbriimonadaceae bacterium]